MADTDETASPLAEVPAQRASHTRRAARAQYATLPLRALALGFDLLIVAGLVAFVALLLRWTTRVAPPGMLAWLFAALAIVAYFTAFEASRWRATPGKRWLGLRVTDRQGQRISVPSALMRSLALLPTLALLGLPALSAGRHKKRQTLLDSRLGVLILVKPTGGTHARSGRERFTPVAVALAGLAIGAQLLLPQRPSGWDRALGVLAQQALQDTEPAMEHVMDVLQSGSAAPGKLPQSLQRTGGDKRVAVAYDARKASFTLQIADRAGRRATILMTPMRSAAGHWRWACGTYGLSAGEIPPQCRGG